MATVIALLISLGVIFSADEATPELIDQYQEFVITDVDQM